jgi:FkbM family methyltransferase
MDMNIDTYLDDSIDRFHIQQIGFFPGTQVPFVILEDGLVFYGLPEEKDEMSVKWVIGVAKVIKDLEFRYFQCDRELTQHSRYRFKPGDVVVELGAYLGFYSMYAARQVGPTGRVIAVELNPWNHVILNMNLSRNYPDTTTAINRGIYSKKGIGTAYLGRDQIAGFRKDVISRFASTIRKFKVQMDTVDNILKENSVTQVDLMIIQVNGNEMDALKGMKQSMPMVKNFAIAAPYSSQGVNHKQAIRVHLQTHGFAVEIKSDWIFAKQP